MKILRSIESPAFSLALLISLTDGHSHASGDGRLDASYRPHSLANLWCSYSTAISNAGPACGSEYSYFIHITLRNIRWIPARSHLPQSSGQLCISAATHDLHNNSGQEASRAQLHIDHSGTCAMRSANANGAPSTLMAAHPPEPCNRRSGFFHRLECRSNPEDPCHDSPETRRQKARRKPQRVTISLRLRHITKVL